MPKKSLDVIYSRPGFMLRRAHQTAISIFESAVTGLGVTPTQYGMLYVIDIIPDVDQISLGGLLGVDRSTATIVARLLEKNGYISRSVASDDRRRKLLRLTEKGKKILAEVNERTEKSQRKLLDPLTKEEAKTFLKLLAKMNTALNDISRTPIRPLQE